MSKDIEGFYGHVRWHPEDVQNLRQEWTLEQCESWLVRNERHLSDRLVELGWEVMEALIDDDCYSNIPSDLTNIQNK